MYCTRDNVVIVGPLSQNTLSDKCEDQSFDKESLFFAHTKMKLEQGNLQREMNLSRTNLFTPGPAFTVSGVNWSSLFDMMCKITSTSLEKHIRLEAVSIMNIIARSCNAYSEREK